MTVADLTCLNYLCFMSRSMDFVSWESIIFSFM